MIDEKKLIEKLDLYISCYTRQPYGRETEGTVELLKEVKEAIADQWIPCNKKLPGPYDTVIITAKMPNDKESLVYMGSINAIREWHILGIANPNDYNVTAWQPLPEPWGGEEK